MITKPTRQRALHGLKPARSTPRVANSVEHQATLAWRLTPRDKWIIRMLHEHRVLTATQITACAFPSFRSGRQRLRELFQWSVLDRFQPAIALGTAPMHYVLGPAGAAVLAGEHGLDVKDLGYRRDRTMSIAHHQRLAHTVGISEWFTTLIARTHHHPEETLHAWWSEVRCARHFGDLVRPDAYGRWHTPTGEAEFFLEFDLGTETVPRVARKIHGYAHLANATAITTPVLVWLPTSRREVTVRRQLHRTWRDLDQPCLVPVATAAADHLNPDTSHPSPAEPVWAPLTATRDEARYPLHDLASVWNLPAASTVTDPAAGTAPPGVLPPPAPMPPPSQPRQVSR
ncbi:replication-relaxation family protein [Saccharopolyspora sp. NPDC003752]